MAMDTCSPAATCSVSSGRRQRTQRPERRCVRSRRRPAFDGVFRVTGAGDRTRLMHLGGDFLSTGGEMTITFAVGGRQVTFTVPAY